MIELPFPPSVNHYYRHVGPRTLISRGGRAYRERVRSILAAKGIKRTQGPLAVQVDIYPPDNRRRDLDNCLKGLLDALQHAGAYDDDSQIVRLIAEKRERVPGGKTVVRIAPYDARWKAADPSAVPEDREPVSRMEFPRLLRPGLQAGTRPRRQVRQGAPGVGAPDAKPGARPGVVSQPQEIQGPHR